MILLTMFKEHPKNKKDNNNGGKLYIISENTGEEEGGQC